MGTVEHGPAYHGGAFWQVLGEDFACLERRKEIIAADVLDAWFPPAPGVVQAVQSHLDWLCRTSPPVHAFGLQRALADVRGVPEKSLLLGGGSSSLIFLAFRLKLWTASRVLILDPTYGEYAHVAEDVVGCHVERFPLSRERQFDVDWDCLKARAASGDFDLIAIVNPNSPTGRALRRDAMLSFLRSVPVDTLVWVDETYVDYLGAGQSVEAFAAGSANVVVCKSMSKVYALSGLRVAYVCGPSEIVEAMRRITPPWSVSLPAQVAAVAALTDPGYYESRYAETHRLRAGLAADLREIGLDVVDGVACFLLTFVPKWVTAREFCERCSDHGLFLRDATSMGSNLGDRAVRFAVKDEATNRRIVHIVRGVLRASRAATDGQGAARTDTP